MKHMKPVALALMLSIGGAGTSIEAAQAGVGKKVLGAVIVGGIAHHYWKKHERKKREERIREEQRREDMAQMRGQGYNYGYEPERRYQRTYDYRYQQRPSYDRPY